MAANELRDAIELIKNGKKNEAREILEPYIIAHPHEIQAWMWELETRESKDEKIRIIEACLQHNPESTLAKKALKALTSHHKTSTAVFKSVSPFILYPDSEVPTESAFPGDLVVTNEPESAESQVQPHQPDPDSEKGNQCSFCGASIEVDAVTCNNCGRVLQPEKVEPEIQTVETKKPKKWYRRVWVKLLAFFLCMPIWCVIELGDPDAKVWAKVLAGIVLIFSVNVTSLLLYWLFTTNASRANLLNWYQYLTDQSTLNVPGNIVRVDGNVQSLGETPFNLVELEAKVYDKDGNLLGNSTRYIDGDSILPGSPFRFQMDVTSLMSSLNGGLSTQQVLYYDSFSDPNSGWTVSKGEEGQTGYLEGQWRIVVDKANYDLWSNPGSQFDNVKIEVDATKLAGEESNRFGLQCRYQDVDNYYFAVISSDGYYGIGKVVNGVQTFFGVGGMQVTDKVYARSTTNHIRFDCVGTRLSLYVNGDYVDAVDDADLTTGDVGLLAGTFENPGTVIAFDNFTVVMP